MNSTQPVEIFSLVGLKLDRASKRRGAFNKRFDRWRPSVALAHVPGVTVIHLIFDQDRALAEDIKTDIETINPDIDVRLHTVAFSDPWELAGVHLALSDFIEQQDFTADQERLFHITTGSHIQQIVIYKLCESRAFPGKLIQTQPGDEDGHPRYQIIDLDLSRYDAIAERQKKAKWAEENELKRGIPTRNAHFNSLINEIEIVARRSPFPILLEGPTGAGKSDLAGQIYRLKQKVRPLTGEFVEVNCATLIGENAMSVLFGHKKGAFTGAVSNREGLLLKANGGLLFLDEIGELGIEEQTMLLSAIEKQAFYPIGGDTLVQSRFELIAGTNRDLREACAKGRFREDLLARIDLWTFRLPSLRERLEDFEPNLDYEIDRFGNYTGQKIRMSGEARKRYLEFARAPDSKWRGNFRDLIGSVRRMGTLCGAGVIGTSEVESEIKRLKVAWGDGESSVSTAPTLDIEMNNLALFEPAVLDEIDLLDRASLAFVVDVIGNSENYAEAARKLFDRTRLKKKQANDSHRIKTWLQRFGIDMKMIPLLENRLRLERGRQTQN